MSGNNEEMRQFRRALRIHDLDTARRMMENGIDFNDRTRGPFYHLFQAAINDHNLPAVQLLIDHGADLTRKLSINCLVDSGQTKDSYVILKLLLDKGARTFEDGKDYNGYSPPLLNALKFASLKYAELLLEHGADIIARDFKGRTALHYAVQNSEGDAVRFVVDLGLHVESIDNAGNSALHWAVVYEKLEACEILLDNGANFNRRNNHGRTPLALARDFHEAAIMTLIRHMAKMSSLNLNINENDRGIIDNHDVYRTYYRQCLQELQDLKVTGFYNNVSIYDVFMESKRVVSRYARNEELATALGVKYYDECFPIYFRSLKDKFDVRVEMQMLRKTAAKTLGNLFKFNDPSPGPD